MTNLTPDQREAAARALRDALMEQKSSDSNWQACREGYLRKFDAFTAELTEQGLTIADTRTAVLYHPD